MYIVLSCTTNDIIASLWLCSTWEWSMDRVTQVQLTWQWSLLQEKFCFAVCTLWPVEYSHILGVYFIMRPGLYTHKQLLTWKQLDTYNYFQSSVHSVSIYVWLNGCYVWQNSWLKPMQLCLLVANTPTPITFAALGHEETGRILCLHYKVFGASVHATMY